MPATQDPIAYHLIPAAAWEAAPVEEPLRPGSLANEGFVHLTHRMADLVEVANLLYRDEPGPHLVLTIALLSLDEPWRYDGDERYPHVYGPLNRSAITAIRPIGRDAEGSFIPIDRSPVSVTAAGSGLRSVRAADVELTVLGPDGSPFARREVVVAQRNHAFRFGCTGFEAIELANDELEGEAKESVERLHERWLELFNAATLPFYWGRFEPRRGQPDTTRILAAARWFVDRDILVKGHPLCWHTVTADWLLPLPTAEIVEAQRARIAREVTDFAGVIDTWDVVNEAVIMPIFAKEENGITRMCAELGRVETVRRAFEAARRANPGATLLLNDFDTSADYERLVEACLEAGIAIDVLGIQSHMHQGYWGVEKTLDVLERFARFGLPIHFTESTLVSGRLMPAEIVDLNDYQVADWPSTREGEARQAEEVVTHYTTLLSHPAVEAITWWGLPDGGWLNAPSGLLRADGSTKPAYVALRGLVKGDWWLSPTTLVTDDHGRLRFSGFLGEYEVSSGDRSAVVRLDRPGPLAMSATLET